MDCWSRSVALPARSRKHAVSIVHDESRISRQPASHTIHPGHAWMLGLVVLDDGSYAPPPVAAGPHTGMVAVPRPTDELPSCTCPDFCELDHEFD